MKKMNRIISAFLAILMMLGTLSIFAINASAAAASPRSNNRPSIYLTTRFNTPEDKFESMQDFRYEAYGYEMRADSVSGEIAVKELATGQILFTNPYDVAASKAAKNPSGPIYELLSQIVIYYVAKDGSDQTYYSYKEAADKGQISVSLLQNGIRVDYSIGEEPSKKLVPRRIRHSDFIEYIYNPIKAAYEEGLITEDEYNYFAYDDGEIDRKKDGLPDDGIYYTRLSLSKISKEDHEEYLKDTPLLAEEDVWKFDPNATNVQIAQVEDIIKRCCPNYSIDMMEENHEEAGYVLPVEMTALFKVALEYSLDEDGLSVRLPANGVRYDTAAVTLKDIVVLPFIGAGNSINEGYTFFPDGSGMIFDATQNKEKQLNLNYNQPMYGIDFAYNNIPTLKNRTPARYPVYGIIAEETVYEYTYKTMNGQTAGPISVSSTIMNRDTIEQTVVDRKGTDLSITENTYNRGFLAIIEEGESLVNLYASQVYSTSEYFTVKTYFNPRPYDTSAVISKTDNDKPFYIVSNSKYNEALRIRYKMLNDEKTTAAAQAVDPSYQTYDTSWMGMAEYYRDYLIANGTLKKLTEQDVEADIPLYIETFGAMETLQSILTMPVMLMTPLTTFENIKTMFDELSADGVNNINFKMTGYANGGMYSTVPYDLEWEDVVGGEDGFKQLVEQANAINNSNTDLHLGLYPDFDFAYINYNKLFDHTYLKSDAARTVDNRYTSKRVYSATQQKYSTFYQLAISPSRYDKFYTELMKNYGEYDISSISLASLGHTLNSDFDNDEPYHREDSKRFTQQALNAIQNSNGKNYSIMMDAANAYTWAYADHIINLDIDSSHHNDAAATVPFIGVVLHGCVQFAGAPLNEESNIDYAILKALENGANLYFLLSYQNTTYLKEDFLLSQNYSVRYDIWRDDVVTYYHEINNLLKDVQTKVITGHEFVSDDAIRVLDFAEVKDQIIADIQTAKDQIDQEHAASSMKEIQTLADALILISNLEAMKADFVAASDKVEDAYATFMAEYTGYSAFFDEQIAIANTTSDSNKQKDALTAIENKIKAIGNAAKAVMVAAAELKAQNESFNEYADALAVAKTVIENNTEISDSTKAVYLAEATNAINAVANANVDLHESYYNGEATSADVMAVSIFAVLEGKVGTDDPAAKKINDIIKKNKFTADDLQTSASVAPDDTTESVTPDTSVEEDANRTKVGKNSVVAVTYGDYVLNNAGIKEAVGYKTFLLNYNTYAVRLEYNGVLYTIAANGYVVVYH